MENNISAQSARLPIPAEGIFSVESWAAIIGEDYDTTRKKLLSLKVPVMKFGAKLFLDAAQFWKKLRAVGTRD